MPFMVPFPIDRPFGSVKKPTDKQADRVFLVHADELKFDQFGPIPDAQIVKGRVQFQHKGATPVVRQCLFLSAIQLG